jgi:hypothetical protein
MTNYTHLIIRGHIVEYMERWRNLYRFSNQGWEGQNASINFFNNHRKQSGGSVGNKGGSSLKCKSIVMWCLLCCTGQPRMSLKTILLL